MVSKHCCQPQPHSLAVTQGRCSVEITAGANRRQKTKKGTMKMRTVEKTTAAFGLAAMLLMGACAHNNTVATTTPDYGPSPPHVERLAALSFRAEVTARRAGVAGRGPLDSTCSVESPSPRRAGRRCRRRMRGVSLEAAKTARNLGGGNAPPREIPHALRRSE